MKTLEFEIGGVKLNMKSNIAESETDTDVNVVRFKNEQALSCKHVLTGHVSQVWAQQPCILNDKQYLASASYDNTIKLWDMSNNILNATLTGHANGLYALTLCMYNGIQMLASGSCDRTIKLRDVSNNTFVHTLIDHTDVIYTLAVYVISGSADCTIKVWNVDTHSLQSWWQ